ncbi:hypothetical protein LguiA_029644 [Lonicera macranthoides]
MDDFLPKSMVFTPKLWISQVFGVVSPFPCSVFSIGGCRWLQRDFPFLSRSIKEHIVSRVKVIEQVRVHLRVFSDAPTELVVVVY